MKLALEDRQRELIWASKEYILGQIDSNEFRAYEDKYMTDYNFVTLDFARVGRRVIHALEDFFLHPVKK
jgi:hypothetical protein